MIPPCRLCVNTGSPPQVRGKLYNFAVIGDCGRITPAGAGKTPVSGTSRVEPEDHPRRCGENMKTKHETTLNGGSPPQVRGKPKYIFKFPQNPRITPADAGKTIGLDAGYSILKDHPRGCGENFSVVNAADKSSGSPPRMRGKPCGSIASIIFVRITPADAGKTRHTRRRDRNR